MPQLGASGKPPWAGPAPGEGAIGVERVRGYARGTGALERPLARGSVRRLEILVSGLPEHEGDVGGGGGGGVPTAISRKVPVQEHLM